MRSKILLLAALLLSTDLVLANGTPTPSTDPSSEATASSAAVGVGVALSSAEQHQSAKAVSDASSEQANAQSTTLNQSYHQVRQTPPAFSGTTNTTAQCRWALGGGGAAPGGAMSFIFTRKDRDCERLIIAQYLRDTGRDIAARQVECRVTEIKEALGEDCLALVNQTPTVEKSRETYSRDEIDLLIKKGLLK